LNEVPAELNKRRNIRFTDPLALDSFETESPIAIASSLHDELERAVQHRYEILFFSYSIFFFFVKNFRAAQDRNTDQHSITVPTASGNNLFQVHSPEQSYVTSRTNEPFEGQQQKSTPLSSSYDKANYREAFQRIKIAGDFNDMSHIEDLEDAVGPLLRAMVIREKYDSISFKSYLTFVFIDI
jgi:hypothetical protein